MVAARPGIPPIHLIQHMKAYDAERSWSLDNTILASSNTVILPLYPQMTPDEQDQVIERRKSKSTAAWTKKMRPAGAKLLPIGPKDNSKQSSKDSEEKGANESFHAWASLPKHHQYANSNRQQHVTQQIPRTLSNEIIVVRRRAR
jgi:hypothetical protein